MHNLLDDIFPDGRNERIPNSLGAQIGSNFGPNGEKWGGIIDDAATLGISGGPLQDGIESYNSFSSLNYEKGFISLYNTYDGVHTIKEDIDIIK